MKNYIIRVKVFIFFVLLINLSTYAQNNFHRILGSNERYYNYDIIVDSVINTLSSVSGIAPGEGIVINEFTLDGTWKKNNFFTGVGTSVFCQKFIRTSDKGFLLVGSTKSSNQDKPDFLIIKLNSKKQVEWKKVIASIGQDVIETVVEGDDGYYFAGNSEVNSTTIQPALFKTDFDGNVIWSKQPSYLSQYGTLNQLIKLGSSFIATTKIDDKLMVIKFNAQGDTLFVKTISAYNLYFINSLTAISESNSFLVASTNMLFCFNDNGQINWAKTLDFSINDVEYKDNKIIIAGEKKPIVQNSASTEGAIAILNREGKFIWATQVCGNSNESYKCITSKGSSIYALGKTDSYGYTVKAYAANFLLSRITPTSDSLCNQLDFVPTISDYPYSINEPNKLQLNDISLTSNSLLDLKEFSYKAYSREICSQEFFAKRYNYGAWTDVNNEHLATDIVEISANKFIVLGSNYEGSSFNIKSSYGTFNVFDRSGKLLFAKKYINRFLGKAIYDNNEIIACTGASILKLDTNGVILKSKTLDFYNQNNQKYYYLACVKIIKLKNGNFLGLFNDAGTGVLMEFNSQLDITIMKEVGSVTYSEIIQLKDGSLILAGGADKLNLVRIDSNYNFIWNYRYDRIKGDQLAITETHQDSIIIFSRYTNYSNNTYPYYLMINKNGEFIKGVYLSIAALSDYNCYGLHQLKDSSISSVMNRNVVRLSKNLNVIKSVYSLSEINSTTIKYCEDESILTIGQADFASDEFHVSHRDSLGFAGCETFTLNLTTSTYIPTKTGVILTFGYCIKNERTDFISSENLILNEDKICKDCYSYSPAIPTKISVEGNHCFGETLPYTVSPNSPGNSYYQWYVSGGYSNIGNSNTNTTNIRSDVNQSGTVTVYVFNSCGDYRQNNFPLNKPAEKPVVAITGNPTICNGSTTTLTASGASSYLWSTGGTDSEETISPNYNTTYTVIGTDKNGCKDTKEISVSVNVCTEVVDATTMSTNLNPNPTNGEFAIVTSSVADNIIVSNALGNVIAERKPSSLQTTISLNQFESGLYFVRVVSGEKSTVAKVVKY